MRAVLCSQVLFQRFSDVILEAGESVRLLRSDINTKVPFRIHGCAQVTCHIAVCELDVVVVVASLQTARFNTHALPLLVEPVFLRFILIMWLQSV